MAYRITSRSQMIDTDEINRGCNKINLAAEKFREYGEAISAESSVCDATALSADKETMEDNLISLGDEVIKIEGLMNQITASIQGTASKIRSNQEYEYQEYLQSQKK